MKEKGALTNFLIMKLGVLIAVIILLGASITMYDSLKHNNQREKLKESSKFVIKTIHEAECLPGKVQLDRKLPEISESYEIIISGFIKDCQIVQVSIVGSENLSKTTLLNKKVNGGKFNIREKNPEKIKISKNESISLKVV